METINIQSLPIKHHHCVLDLGCGEGRHAIASSYHFPDANVIAADLDFSSAHTALEKHRDFIPEHKNALYIQASGFSLPFQNESFDHIICSEVLEHIEQYPLFIDEIVRILKPQGYLSISVPRAWPERICWLLSKEYYHVDGGHVRIFNGKALRKEIVQRQFSFQRRHWAHALHAPYWWLRCAHWNHGNENVLSSIYHKMLVWDLLKRPWFTRFLERCLNPILGKSVVLYFRKESQR